MVLVDVLLPVYNAEANLERAIASIVRQTMTEWRLTIIDDASKDGSREVIRRWMDQDKRIHGLFRDTNRGPGSAINFGAMRTRAPLLAIMHADDIAAPQRLELQWRFMGSRMDVDTLGSGAVYVNAQGHPLVAVRPPRTHEEIRQSIHRRPPFVHSTVMMRRDFLASVGGYAPLYRVEDADLWFRGMDGHRYHNLQEVLMVYRMPNRPTVGGAARHAMVEFRGLRRAPIPAWKKGVGILRFGGGAFMSAAGRRGRWASGPSFTEDDLRYVASVLPRSSE